jgi:hypothetical protein
MWLLVFTKESTITVVTSQESFSKIPLLIQSVNMSSGIHSEFWESDRTVEPPWVEGAIVVPLELQAGMH